MTLTVLRALIICFLGTRLHAETKGFAFREVEGAREVCNKNKNLCQKRLKVFTHEAKTFALRSLG